MVSLRTIFLLIRGEYMAGMALRLAKRDIESLSKAELANIRVSQQMAHYALFAGGAMVAFGGMVMMSLMKVMEKYGTASRTMAKFNATMNRAMANLAKGLIPVIEAMTPFINFIAKLLEMPLVAQLVGWGTIILIVAGALLFAGGVILQSVQFIGLLTGSMKLATLGTSLFGKSVTTTGQQMMTTYFVGTQVAKAGTDSLTHSVRSLGIAIGVALGGFMLAVGIVNMVANVFGKTTGIIVGITIAVIGLAVAIMALKGVLSLGASVAQDVAIFAASMAAGGAIMAGYTAATYQKGTSFVRKGGLAVVHGGEEIKSARESTATSKMEKEREVGQPSYKRTTWHVPISIGTVYTKADRDNLDEEIRRALKKALDKKA